MYQVDSLDRVVPLDGLPPSCTGAPLPVVIADENALFVAYRVSIHDPGFDGTNPRSVGPAMRECYAIVEFREPSSSMFGYPNDEALAGHPLYSRGLSHYAAYEVLDSSWVRTHVRMNEVRFPGSAWLFAKNRHFILTFHDSTFECIAREVQAHSNMIGSRRDVIAHINGLLRG